MLTCQELVKLVTDYLEGRLGRLERVRFDLHVLMCPTCRAYVRQMKETVATLGAVPPDPVPKDVEADLLEAFRDWKRSS